MISIQVLKTVKMFAPVARNIIKGRVSGIKFSQSGVSWFFVKNL